MEVELAGPGAGPVVCRPRLVGLRRRSGWRDGEKLWGQVMGVSVTPAWNGADSMDGDRSPARVTLRLSLEGREVSLEKDFPKVLAAPALGQRVQVLYRRSTGEWALWKDVRSWWVLWAILAATAVAVFLLLLLEEEPWPPSSPTTP